MDKKTNIDEFLEKQYSPSQWVARTFPEGQDVVQYFIERGKEATKLAQENSVCDLNVKYGEGSRHVLDIYYPNENSQNDVLIFIHGGYWQILSKDEYTFFGSQIKTWGVTLVMVNYDLAPAVSIDEMIQQIKQAVIFVAGKFPQSKLFLSGHSAGGHLSAMMLTTDWEDESIKTRVKGVCLISGIYDLVPLIKTTMNAPLKLDREAALRNSPMNILTTSERLKVHCKVLIVVGKHDSPPFHQQAKQYTQLLEQHSVPVTYMEVPEVDHFDILERCSDKEYTLNQVKKVLMNEKQYKQEII